MIGARFGPGGCMATVNLDALIPREDFEFSPTEDTPSAQTPAVSISELESTRLFYNSLRKPDFQRETTEWSPQRVVDLIKTFAEGDLIPGVILWKNRGLIFVVDGAHRLSALAAWVQNDYGDGERSLRFFENDIPEDQREIAQKTRELVRKQIGTYQEHVAAGSHPRVDRPEITERARTIASRGIELQWVRGNAAKAQESFIRINQKAVQITPQELELIENRKLPNVIAARALLRRATGHPYWSAFSGQTQERIKKLATDTHDLMFSPQAKLSGRSIELPAGGPIYAGTALRMVYDFINLCVSQPTKDADQDGHNTIEYLTKSRRVMRLLLSNDPSSLGLHPAVYFYSWTGKQQAIQFLTVANLVIDLERAGKLRQFTDIRSRFEDFLIANRPLLQQVVRKFGSKSSGSTNLRAYYDAVIESLENGVDVGKIPEHLRTVDGLFYLAPDESLMHEGRPGRRFSSQVKAGATLRELVKTAVRCAICNGLVPHQAMSVDHKQRVADGGSSGAHNAQITHPFCNTTVKG